MQHGLFGNAGVLFMSDVSPLPTSSSFLALFQFLQLSQLTGATFQFSPSGKHTEELNNFPIYMHRGYMVSFTHTWALKETQTKDTALRGRFEVQFTLAVSRHPQHLVITVRIRQEELKCFHVRRVLLFLVCGRIRSADDQRCLRIGINCSFYGDV